MDFAYLIQHYGYLALALGSFLEGEAALLAGTLAAYHGHLELQYVLPIAAIASFAGDLPYFFAARRYGPSVLLRRPSFQGRKERLERLLHRHQILLVLALRFFYGFRVAGLFALGLSKMSTLRFLILDFFGALVWASAVVAAGHGIGQLAKNLHAADVVGENGVLLIALLICSSALIFFAQRRRMQLLRVERRR